MTNLVLDTSVVLKRYYRKARALGRIAHLAHLAL